MNSDHVLQNFRVRYLFLMWLIYMIATVGFVISISLPVTDDGSIPIVFAVGFYLAPVIWLLHLRRRGFNSSSLIGKPSFRSQILPSLMIAVFLQISAYALTWLMGVFLYPILPQRLPSNVGSEILDSRLGVQWTYPIMVFVTIVAGPIIEEFLYRGAILNRWAYKWGVRRAIILSSLVFAVMHGGAYLLWAFTTGVVLSLLYTMTRNLVVPIACHMLTNVLAVLERWLPYSNAESGGLAYHIVLLLLSFSLGVVPIALFIRKTWPVQNAPVPYTA